MAASGDPKWLLGLETPLGADALIPIAFSAVETISTPFEISVDAVSRARLLDPDQLLFNSATLTVRPNAGDVRIFNGRIRAVTANGMPDRGWWHYTLQIVPKLWFMSQTVDCRIFQRMQVQDILQQLCVEAGQAISLKTVPAAALDYVTQYNETDLQFFARLLQQAGYFYFFDHSKTEHTIVIADANSAFPAKPTPLLNVVHEGNGIDTLSTWQQTRRTAWGSARLIDYDPAKPDTRIDESTSTKLKAAAAASRDVTLWPALTLQHADATARTRFMIEAAEADASLINSTGRMHTLAAGSRFKLLLDPFNRAANVEHVVRSVVHTGTDETYLGGTAAATYANTLSVFPAALPWREKMMTPRPVMAGIFGAVVLGKPGEEIHADSLGRIKVRFFWDHRDDTAPDKGTWVRVIQPWAGNSWGWQHLPRVGTEVAVSFMDADPDRPVVVGGMYNATMVPVFAVPGEQNKSGWRTRSTKSGGKADFSEFSVDDTAGSEVMFTHAQKDMTTEVEHDQALTVDNDRKLTVKHDEIIKVTNDQTIEVSNRQSIKVTAGREAKISSGGDSLTVQAGDLTIKVSSGQVSIEAMTAIELKVGGNSIKIDPSGITIAGTMIKLNGQAMVQVKGPMTQVNGDGMLMMKGGIVMVN